jgi:MFS family permease
VAEPRRAARSLGVAALTLAIQNGIAMAFAVLYLPLVAEFNASRGDVAVVQSAVLLVGGFSGPLIGWAFDRLGPRRLFQAGALLAAAAFVGASRVESLPALVIVYGILGGVGLSTLGSQANMIVAALWYPHARGRAIAVADLGTGFGAFCFIPLAQVLVGTVGWRGTLLVWAAVLVAVVVPVNVLQGLPQRAQPGPRAPRGPEVLEWTLARALRSPAFWWLGLMRFFAACAFALLNVHMVAYAVSQDVAPATAAAALGTVSLVSLAGRLATGWLCDRIGRAPTLTSAYASAAVGIGGLALVAITGGPGWLALYVLFYGLAQGSSGIVGSARAADVFAGPAFGTIYGVLTLALGPGEALGAWIGGEIYDVTGSYLGAFAFTVAALAASLVAIWRVTPPQHGPGTLGGRR